MCVCVHTPHVRKVHEVSAKATLLTSKMMGFETKAIPSPATAPDCPATDAARQKAKMNPTTLNIAVTAEQEGREEGERERENKRGGRKSDYLTKPRPN